MKHIDKRPLTNEKVLAMTVKELMEHMMDWEEAKESAMGSCHLPWMEMDFYEGEPSSVVQIHFQFINRPKPSDEYTEQVRIILKTE